MRYILLSVFLLYLISCTTNDGRSVWPASTAQAVMASVSTGNVTEERRKFEVFLAEVSGQQMISAAEEDLQETAKLYFPDSTVSHGYDLHAQEIGHIDSFHLLYYEYFDLYESWSKNYLGIYTPTGQAREVKRLWNVSFEGNININVINQQILEIAYYDFFDLQLLRNRSVFPIQHIQLSEAEMRNRKTEGFIYEYYRLDVNGEFQALSQNAMIPEGRVFPQASAKLLTTEELLQYPNESLALMRNEILATYGYSFPDTTIRQQFLQTDWYQARFETVNHLLSDIERLNLEKIQQIEREEY